MRWTWRIRTLMLVIAILGVSISWWKWHMAMLGKSERCLAFANEADAAAASWSRASQMWIKDAASRKRLLLLTDGEISSEQRIDLERMAKHAESLQLSSRKFAKKAAEFRFAAAFPWTEIAMVSAVPRPHFQWR